MHWQNGKCLAGKQCIYLHRSNNPSQANASPTTDDSAVGGKGKNSAEQTPKGQANSKSNPAKKKEKKSKKKDQAAVAVDAETGLPLEG